MVAGFAPITDAKIPGARSWLTLSFLTAPHHLVLAFENQVLPANMDDFAPTNNEPYTGSLDELFLQICVSENPQFVASAWQQWQARTSVEAADAGFHRLMPLLCRNLDRAGIQHPSMAKLRGTIRQAWVKNQRLRDAVRPALHSVIDAGGRVILLGDTALAHSIYSEPGLRAMSSFDFAVPMDAAGAAIQALELHGWRAAPSTTQVHSLAYRTWVPCGVFQNREEQTIRLHWHMIPSAASSILDRELSDNLRAVHLEGAPVAILDATPMFWATCIAASRSPASMFVDVADAALILRQSSRIDWQQIVLLSVRYRLSRQIGYSLSQLASLLGSAVPTEIIEELQRVPVSKSEEAAYQAGLVAPAERTPRQRLSLQYARYCQTLYGLKMASSLANAAAFVKHTHNLRSILNLPAHFARKGFRHLVRHQGRIR